MGAFWHLFAPVTVTITMDKPKFEAVAENETALPEPFARDFFEVNRNEWSVENKILGTRHKIDLTYMLSDESMEQIKPFLNDAWHLIEAEDSSVIPEGLDDFIRESLTPLSISRASLEKTDENFRDIEDNYYLSYESVPGMVVYQGWPRELHSDTSMGGFVILYSYEKMNLIPEETVLFFNLKDKIKRELSKRYTIAKYICTLGF
ncbi:hypothetical protein QUF72_21920 [Desulfobacterales bacterium HSG2]|nr:hypothetical protein [Desulfobacterales bacterium HSG2]